MQLRGLALALAVIAVVPAGACGHDRSAVRADDTDVVHRVAAAAGCDSLEELRAPDDRYSPTSRHSCVADGHYLLIDRFDGGTPAAWLRHKYGASGLNPCADGSQPRAPWIVLGRDWALFTNAAGTARSVARRFDADVVDPGANGPPVSTPLEVGLICERG
jgi:hypothetical protein